MSGRCRSLVLVLLASLLAAGCGPTGFTATPVPSTETPLLPPAPTIPAAAKSAPLAGTTPLWSVQALSADDSVEKIEVAGTHREIGSALAQWYKDRGFLPHPLTDDQQQTARELLAFYEQVHPSILQQLRGFYAAYGLDLENGSQGIAISEAGGVRILLPGLVEHDACSVVFARPESTADGHARLGRNYDWPGVAPDTTLILSHPEDGYATMVMTRNTPGLSAADGMNSQGLAFGFASVEDSGYEPPAGPGLVSGFAYRLILESCANVEEAIAMLRSVPISFIKSSPGDPITHILLADRSGASAVVEFLPEGVVVSRADTPYQVMTNSLWAGPADQPACPRYQTATAGLEEAHGTLDSEGLWSVMSSIHGSTQWTSLYDLEDLSLILTLPAHDPSTRYHFSLADFMERTSTP